MDGEGAVSQTFATLDDRVEDLLHRLTLEEKAALLAGADGWTTVAIPRVGLESIRMADGPNGYRSTQSEGSNMPSSISPDLSNFAATVAARLGRHP